jgi:hypothetical protein
MNARNLVLTGGLLLAAQLSWYAALAPRASQADSRPLHLIQGLPLAFEENRGQMSPQVDFTARGLDYGLTLGARGARLTAGADCGGCGEGAPLISAGLELVGADRAAKGVGERPLEAKAHYFVGRDPSAWVRNVRNFGRVRYQGVYPGIDIVYYGTGRKLEYDLVVQPGARPDPIRLRFPEASTARVSPEGDLLLTVRDKELRQLAPVCYQEHDGHQQRVEGRYVVAPGSSAPEVRFELGAYDRGRTLVIDPVLEFSTMLGGSGTDSGEDMTLDPQGNLWITGYTTPYPLGGASDFPTLNPRQGHAGSADAIVLKLSLQGTLLHSSFLGGTEADFGRGISVDGSGRPTVVGETRSTDFPLASPAQGAFGGGLGDGFITRLSADGSQLLFSTYLGGDQEDLLRSVEVDAAGNSVVAGTTESLALGTTGAFQPEFAGRSLFRSTNGAASWTGVTAGLPSSEIRVLDVAASAPDILYAGTREHGIYRSDDGGSSWRAVNGDLPLTPSVRTLAIDPTNPNRVYVSFESPIVGTSYVYRTTNGGLTWVDDSEGLTRADDFIYDPTSPENMLAAVNLPSGTEGGVRRRLRDVPGWFTVGISNAGVRDLAQEPVDNRFIYAATHQGIRKSTNFGTDFGAVLLAGDMDRVVTAPSAPGTVYALNSQFEASTVSRSTNGGASWTTTVLPITAGTALAVDPLDANTLYLAYQDSTGELYTSAAVLKSTDGGQTFAPVLQGLGAENVGTLVVRASGGNSVVYAGANPSPDALVARYEASGIRTYVSYLGGVDTETGNGVSLAGSRAAVTGMTYSADFPLQSARQATRAGRTDAFATRFSANGATLEVSTYLGGSGNDVGLSLDTDAAGNFLLGGDTRSTDFPGTATGFQPAHAGNPDAYLVLLTANGASIPYGTYLGGSGFEGLETVRFGPEGHAFLFGDTSSTNFPTRDAFQTTRLGSVFRDTFVARINPAVTGNNSLIYSTYLGGTSADVAGGMAVDAAGEVHVTGLTWGQFPLVQAPQTCYQGPNIDFFAGDLFISRVGPGPAAPIAPRSIQAAAPSASVVNLTWVDRTANETGYRVLRKEGPAAANTQYVELATLAANSQSYQDTLAVPNTTYSYVLVAFNAQGESVTCPVTVTTPVGSTPAPAAPTNLTATAISGTQINLAWQDNSDNETGFQIQRKEGVNGAYGPIHTTGIGVTSYQDLGVMPGRQYFYQVRAQGAGGFSAFSNEANATTPQAEDTTPPQITNVTVDPRQLSSAGGAVTISADVVDAGGTVATVVAVIDGPTDATVTLQLTTGNRYSGVWTAPSNPGPQARTYAVEIRATDAADNQGTASGGTISVAAPTPDTTAPQITNIQVSPRTLPSAGGPVEISADVVDAGGVASVVARIQPPTGPVQTVTLTLLSGSTYSGTFNAPANASASNLVYGISIRATDASSNQANQDAGVVTVLPPSMDTTPPQITNVQVTPRTLPSAGGAVEIRADVVDAGGVASVVARIQPPTGPVQSVTLTLLSDSTYSGTFNAPANASASNRVYGVSIRATDTSGNQANQDAGTVTVSPPASDTTPPQITNIQVSPRSLPSAGGPVTISADVVDAGGVASVVARIQPPTGPVQSVTLTLLGDATYSGTYNAPANSSTANRVYGVSIRATDTSSNQANQDAGVVTVLPPSMDTTPPQISNVQVSPTELASSGGPVEIRADVTDAGGVGSITGRIQPPSGPVQTVTLTLQSGTTYVGTYNAPANNSATDRTYNVTVRATDTAGNQADLAGPSFTILAPIPNGDGEIEVTPSSLRFGDVRKGKSATKRIRVRNVGTGSVTVTLSGGGQAFTAAWVGGGLTPTGKRRQQAPTSVLLAPGETREVKVTFKPKATKAYQSQLQFSPGAATPVTVSVSGRGCLTNPTE